VLDVAFSGVRIESLAFALPPHRVTSAAIEADLAETYARLSVPQGCIETLVGVRARRFQDDGATIDELASDIVRRALSPRPDLVARVGMCVSTSVCKDYVEPSVAALVAGALDFGPECQTFDVGNACLGFLTGIDLCARRIASGEVDVAVVVAAESSRHVVRSTVERLNRPTSTLQDFREALPTLTLGSASVAMVLVHERLASTTHTVNDVIVRTDPRSSRICIGTPDWMRTDAQLLLKNGVELAAQAWAQAQPRFGWNADVVDHFLCHQVGATHLATLFKRLELPLDKAVLTYPELGNTGPAAVPVALGLARDGWEHAPAVLQPGQRLALLGIGSGLTVAMMDVTW
jgi:3-oxoacyl-[acyl-carrier-protein] synthase-3